MSTNDQLISIMALHSLTCADVAELLYKSQDAVKKWRQTKGRVPMDKALLELLQVKLVFK